MGKGPTTTRDAPRTGSVSGVLLAKGTWIEGQRVITCSVVQRLVGPTPSRDAVTTISQQRGDLAA